MRLNGWKGSVYAQIGCRLPLFLAAIVVASACSTSESVAPTSPSAEAGPEATMVVTASLETVATSIGTIPADVAAARSAELYTVMEANQCLSCHIAGDRGNGAVGPSLNGLAERIRTYGLEQSAEDYVYESLVNPAAYLPASCPNGQCANVMPSYADRLSEDELNALVTFLLSLPSKSP